MKRGHKVRFIKDNFKYREEDYSIWYRWDPSLNLLWAFWRRNYQQVTDHFSEG